MWQDFRFVSTQDSHAKFYDQMSFRISHIAKKKSFFMGLGLDSLRGKLRIPWAGSSGGLQRIPATASCEVSGWLSLQ